MYFYGRAHSRVRESIACMIGRPCLACRRLLSSSTGICEDHPHFSTTKSCQVVIDNDNIRIAKKVNGKISFARDLACLRGGNLVQMNRKPYNHVVDENLKFGIHTINVHGQERDSRLCTNAGDTRVEVNTNGVNHRSMSLAKSLACLPDEASENGRDMSVEVNTDGFDHRSVSLAKSLACLPGDATENVRRDYTRMELKRAMEIRIKKRVKEQHVNGKFCDLMEKVISEPSNLKDSYDIVRLNSNINLKSKGDDICFDTISKQLKGGDFDVKANVFSFSVKGSKREGLVLPNLKLRVIQEAIRVTLEVVYRPSFSKFSHGCRSGRGPLSALRYVSEEMCKSDWWFTLHMDNKVDNMILSNLIEFMQEKIEDNKLFSFIHLMFDAKVLCLHFGGHAKGHGLPQEGALSPILMNIYLDKLDSQLFRLFMRYEGLSEDLKLRDGRSNLRHWFRRQIKENNEEELKMEPRLRLYACRYMDEVVIAVSGPKETAIEVNRDIHSYLNYSLHIRTTNQNAIVAVNDATSHGIQFVGMVVSATPTETGPLRAVHKLKEKVQLFASQKQEAWNTGMVRIGKKCLGYGLRRIKESEIKQLGLGDPLLDQISCHRKEGMKTEHWFNVLIKIWLQDVNAAVGSSVNTILAKQVAEPGVPQELRESFYRFQKCAKSYVSSETSSMLELLSDVDTAKKFPLMTSKIDAPIYHIQKKLMSYGLVNGEGVPRYVSALVLQDDTLIVQWFSGLVKRWLKWFSKHHNFKDIKSMLLEYIKKSCIRTLAAKHKVDESLIEKRFELELNDIPLTEDLETDLVALASCPYNGDDEALMYGILHSGLCKLSLSRIGDLSEPPICSIMGCSDRTPCIYTLHTRDRQEFPGWKTGFSTGIHMSLNMKRFALCTQHVKDLYLGQISLQSIEFGSLKR